MSRRPTASGAAEGGAARPAGVEHPAQLSLFDVRHQPSAQRRLQAALTCGRIPHAFVFEGLDGVGKRTLALRLARRLLCAQPMPAARPPAEYAAECESWSDACGACTACGLMARDAHPDCHFVQRMLVKYHEDASVRSRMGAELGIPVIRQFVIDAVGRRGQMGEHKVFIIEEAERLNEEAQNGLLKTLEEPPAGTCIILLASRLDALLPTTLSRVQHLRFRPLPLEFVEQRLTQLRPDLSADAVHFLARHQPGSLGLALRLGEQGTFDINQRLVHRLLELDRLTVVDAAKEFDNEAVELGKKLREHAPDSTESVAARQARIEVLGLVATLLRDVLHAACGAGLEPCNRSSAERIDKLAAAWGPQRTVRAIKLVADCQRDLAANTNGLLTLERALIELARPDVRAPR